jgi:hypothetical protein
MSFKILQEDRDFVEKIAQLIPLEQADRESLTTMLAGLRLMHTSKSPLAAHLTALESAREENIRLRLLLWSSVRALGGEHTANLKALPANYDLEIKPKGDDAFTVTTTLNK